ncbi:MAG: class I SAM-dependent methyltransferase [Methanoregula sp.]|jgi:ubiquinone/menaquinone biosynthesis C-methylase UbiE|nr:class I SAM-dependent methyltransferase [Methanoregula sp.]
MSERKGKWAFAAERLSANPIKFIYQTEGIKDFLENEDKCLICGLKGLGKTLLLKAKRQTLLPGNDKNKGYILIPSDNPYDIFPISHPSEDKWEFLQNNLIWEEIWGISIGLSVISYFLKYCDENQKEALFYELNNIPAISFEKRGKKEFTNLLNLLLERTKVKNQNPSQFLSIIIRALNRHMINKSFLGEVNSIIQPILSSHINSQCAVFIDEVDKTVEKLMVEIATEGEKSTNVHLTREKLHKLQNIWVSSQIGLIYYTYRIYPHQHIRIYATIRQEILGKMTNDPNLLRYKDIILILNYNKNELKRIFIKGIETWEKNNLVQKSLFKYDKIKAFLGFNSATALRFVTKNEMDIFDYFYIYSIQRPRDIMHLGGSISDMPPKERNQEIIQKLVNKMGEENIHNDYLLNFEYLLNIKFDKIYPFINKNVLSRYELMNICRRYNNLAGQECDCKNCSCEDIFNLFYRIGVLGILKRDPYKENLFIQEFLPPEKRDLIIATSELPQSEHDLYLIHPALAHRISQTPKRLKIFEFLPLFIGDGCHVDLNGIRSLTGLQNEKSKPHTINENMVRKHLKEGFKDTLQKNYLDSKKEAQSKSLEFIKNSILRNVSKNKPMVWLDVGCGRGRCLNVFEIFIEEDPNWYHNINYIGIDTSQECLDKAKETASNFENIGLKTSFFQVDATDIYLDPRYDMVSAILLLHELDPIQLPHILRKMLLALKNDGYLVIYDFQEPSEQENRIVVWDNDDIKYILKNALGAGIGCQKMKGREFPEEISFFSCYATKKNYDEAKFENFIKNYYRFINRKIQKIQKKHDSLEIEFIKHVQEILGIEKIDLHKLTEDEIKKITFELEPIYQIKFEKMDLLNQEILYLNKRYPVEDLLDNGMPSQEP